MERLIDALQEAYSSVTVTCRHHEYGHTIPVDVVRDNVRLSLGKDRFGNEKTDGDIPQVCRVVVDTRIITRRFKQFLGSLVEDEDGNEYSGGWKHVAMAVSFLATDWYDLFGKRIAWKMAKDVEGLLLARGGIWDGILADVGACILKKDYDSMVDGMKRNWGIENIYQVTIAFQLTDARIIVPPVTDVVGDPPIESIEFEVEME